MRKAIAAIILVIAARLALPSVGRFLVVSDPVRSADAIVVLASNRDDRVYEAGMLFREKRAPRILLSHPDESKRRAIPRSLGINVPTDYDLQRSILKQMGVPDSKVADIAGSPLSTEDEARLIARTMREQNLHHIIVVTSAYHSRRARLYLRSAAPDKGSISVVASRYDYVTPAEWWRRPYDRADVVLEWLKLPKCWWSLLRARFT